jgi:hypothetical protein
MERRIVVAARRRSVLSFSVFWARVSRTSVAVWAASVRRMVTLSVVALLAAAMWARTSGEA